MKNTCTHASLEPSDAREAEDVLVRGPDALDELLLRHVLDRADLVAEQGGALELQLVGRRLHLALERLHDLARLAFEEEQGLADDLVVLLLRAVGRAGRDAAMDEVVEAGSRVGAGDRLGAGAPGEELLDDAQRRAHGRCRRVRPEVARAIVVHAARDLDPRPLVLHVDAQVGVVLVVLEADVEEGLVALDQRRLQVHRLAVGLGDDVLEVLDLLDERPRLHLERVRRAEVVAHAVAQVGRLADVDHVFLGVAHDVDAGLRGQRREPGGKAGAFGVVVLGGHSRTSILPASHSARRELLTLGVRDLRLGRAQVSSSDSENEM